IGIVLERSVKAYPFPIATLFHVCSVLREFSIGYTASHGCRLAEGIRDPADKRARERTRTFELKHLSLRRFH
ncbi:MAG: hypothetical protein RJA72_1659, partial [Pseudomonadota bacterium]